MLTLVLAQAAAALVVILIVSVAVPCFRGPAGDWAHLDLAMVYRSGSHRACSSSGRRSCGESCPTTGRSSRSCFWSSPPPPSGYSSRSAGAPLPAAEPFAFGQVHVWTAAGALAAVAAFLVASAFFYRIAPHGIEDAVSIWNLRARFFFRGGDHWTDGFRPVNWHGDYPLLLPCEVARCWTWAGSESTLVPALLGLSFSLATAAALAGGLGLIRGASAGLIAGATLLATRLLSRDFGQPACRRSLGLLRPCISRAARAGRSSGTVRRANSLQPRGVVPWSCRLDEERRSCLPLGTASLALDLSEGGRTVGALHRRDGCHRTRGNSGCCCHLRVQDPFRTSERPGRDHAYGRDSSRISDPSRYLAILISVVEGLGKIGPGLIPALAAYAWLLGRSRDESFRWRPLLATGLIVFACYFTAYLISPHPLAWHLECSLDRVLLHFWPAMLFGFFACVHSPEEAGLINSPIGSRKFQ